MSLSTPRIKGLFLIALVAAACWGASLPAGETVPPSSRALTPDVRARLDKLALQQELENLNEETIDLAGNATAWLISQASLTPRQEADHAGGMHKQLLTQNRALDTPPEAERVWQRLLKQLPSYLKPTEFRFTLTVLDVPRLGAFSWGAGRVYITRPLLERLLENPERGETALAFVLAQQLGHIARDHCRRGWQLVQIQEDLKGNLKLDVDAKLMQRILETSVHASGQLVYFLYTRAQSYEADCFAWQLCRNAGLDLDHALDALRYQAVLNEPRLLSDPNFRPARAAVAPALQYYLSEEPVSLLRLRRLMMERDGLVANEKDCGLFRFDPATAAFSRCAPGSVAEGVAPIIFVHGLRGERGVFLPFLTFLGEQKELMGRPLLVLRHPNNESLARCGLFLTSEMARVVKSPEKAMFICHSAGGLILRYYTEVKKGAFDRAFLLATPHQGSNLMPLKYLVDLAQFAVLLKQGLPDAIAATIPEGRGEITYDLHPDSLFLRHLGQDAKLAARYHVYSGQILDSTQALTLRFAFLAAKTFLKDRVFTRLEMPLLKSQAIALVDGWELPDELLRGDGVVTVRSATLRKAGQTTATACNHLTIVLDEEVMRGVLQGLVGR